MLLEVWAGFIVLILMQLACGATYSSATVGFGGGGTTSSSTTVEKVTPATPEDIALKKIDLEFSGLNLQRFKQEQSLIDRLLAEGGEDSIVQSARLEQELFPLREQAARAELELAPELSALQRAQITAAQERIPLEQALLEEQVAIIERGGLPSEEVQAEIDTLLGASRDIGLTTIDRSAERARRSIIEDITPSRGLRPTDSPILADLERIGEQQVEQTGQLERKLVEARSSLSIGQPIQVAQLAGQITNPALNRPPGIPSSAAGFLSQIQPSAPALSAIGGARAASGTNFAPTFGPKFFVTGRTDQSSRKTAPGIGRGFLSNAFSVFGGGLGKAAAGRIPT